MSKHAITSPLEGEVDREAGGRGVNASSPNTPLPDPPPQGGREQAERTACSERHGQLPQNIGAGKRVCVARIGAAHGVRGEVNLWSFTADPFAVTQYGPLESADGARSFGIEALRPGKSCLVARFAGVTDRSAAERLNNIELFVPRERLPSPGAADEFYHADLIGLAVVDLEGVELGRVVAVQNFGAGDLIEVLPIAGGDTVLLPFTEAVVPVVDIAGGRVLANPPEGIFNEDSDARPPSAASTRSAPKARPR